MRSFIDTIIRNWYYDYGRTTFLSQEKLDEAIANAVTTAPSPWCTREALDCLPIDTPIIVKEQNGEIDLLRRAEYPSRPDQDVTFWFAENGSGTDSDCLTTQRMLFFVVPS